MLFLLESEWMEFEEKALTTMAKANREMESYYAMTMNLFTLL